MSIEKPEDLTPIWKMFMETLKKRMIGLKTDIIVKEAISEWYKEAGLPEPNWQTKRNDDWYKEYLKSLEEDGEG